MGQTKGPQAPRVTKPKTAKQVAKAKANAEKAAQRLAAHQRQQAAILAARRSGMVGTDQEIESAIRERTAREGAVQFVTGVLSGPHGDRVRKWVGPKLKGDPITVATVIRNYCNTQGFRVAG